MSGKPVKEKIIILDVPVSPQIQAQLAGFGCTLADPQALTQGVLEWTGWLALNPSSTLLVFPGNGAATVRGLVNGAWHTRWPKAVSVFAKRGWEPGEEPLAMVGRIYPRGMILGMRDVVVIDDVISSGVTCRTLVQVNQPWIPAARWHALAWIKQRAAGLRGFASSFGALEVGTPNRKSPVNSLSDLLEDEVMARDYAARNYHSHHEGFLEILQKLKKTG